MTEDRSPFRVMCQMWGVKNAVEKCREMGIPVPEDEVREQEEQDRAAREALKNIVKRMWRDDDAAD